MPSTAASRPDTVLPTSTSRLPVSAPTVSAHACALGVRPIPARDPGPWGGQDVEQPDRFGAGQLRVPDRAGGGPGVAGVEGVEVGEPGAQPRLGPGARPAGVLRGAGGPGGVGLLQLGDQQRDRPAVEDGVLEGQGEAGTVVVVQQRRAHQRRAGEVEGAGPLGVEDGGRVGAPHVVLGPRQRDAVGDALDDAAVGALGESGAQLGMPVEQVGQRGAQRARVDVGGQVEDLLHDVGGVGGVERGVEEEALLQRGHRPGEGDGAEHGGRGVVEDGRVGPGGHGDRVVLGHERRELGDGAVGEDLPRGDQQAGLAGPHDQPDRQDRVAAEGEEVVVDTEAGHTEDLRHQVAQQRLARRAGAGPADLRGQVGGGQRGPVGLAVGQHRHRRQRDDGGGHHPVREPVAQVLAQSADQGVDVPEGGRAVERGAGRVRGRPVQRPGVDTGPGEQQLDRRTGSPGALGAVAEGLAEGQQLLGVGAGGGLGLAVDAGAGGAVGGRAQVGDPDHADHVRAHRPRAPSTPAPSTPATVHAGTVAARGRAAAARRAGPGAQRGAQGIGERDRVGPGPGPVEEERRGRGIGLRGGAGPEHDVVAVARELVVCAGPLDPDAARVEPVEGGEEVRRAEQLALPGDGAVEGAAQLGGLRVGPPGGDHPGAEGPQQSGVPDVADEDRAAGASSAAARVSTSLVGGGRGELDPVAQPGAGRDPPRQRGDGLGGHVGADVAGTVRRQLGEQQPVADTELQDPAGAELADPGDGGVAPGPHVLARDGGAVVGGVPAGEAALVAGGVAVVGGGGGVEQLVDVAPVRDALGPVVDGGGVLGGRGDDPGGEAPVPRYGLVDADDGLGDVRVGPQHRLDLAGLDPVAADLDLVVDAAQELQLAAPVDAHEVAGAVEPRARGPERVGDEPLRGQARPVQVAPGQTGAAEVELALLPVGDRGQVGAQHVRVGHRVGDADRHHRPGPRRVAPAQRRVDGDLGRTVGVEHRPALRPARDQLRGHPLGTGEQGRRGERDVRAQRREQRGRQDHHRHRVLVGVVGELGHRQPQLGGHHDQPPAGQQRHAQLPERDVEAGRGEPEDPVVRADTEPLGLGGDELGDTAVGQHDALGPPGGAGGVDDVGGAEDVDVGHRGDRGGGDRRPVGVVVEQHGRGPVGQRQLGGDTGRAQHDGRAGVVEHQRGPRRRLVRVDRKVCRARTQDRHLRDDEVHPTRYGERDQPLRSRAARAQHRREAPRPLVEPGVGELLAALPRAALHRHGVRRGRDLPGEQLRPGRERTVRQRARARVGRGRQRAGHGRRSRGGGAGRAVWDGSAGSAFAQAARPQVGPVRLDEGQARRLVGRPVLDRPAGGDLGERGPQRVLALVVDQRVEAALGVVERVRGHGSPWDRRNGWGRAQTTTGVGAVDGTGAPVEAGPHRGAVGQRRGAEPVVAVHVEPAAGVAGAGLVEAAGQQPQRVGGAVAGRVDDDVGGDHLALAVDQRLDGQLDPVVDLDDVGHPRHVAEAQTLGPGDPLVVVRAVEAVDQLRVDDRVVRVRVVAQDHLLDPVRRGVEVVDRARVEDPVRERAVVGRAVAVAGEHRVDLGGREGAVQVLDGLGGALPGADDGEAGPGEPAGEDDVAGAQALHPVPGADDDVDELHAVPAADRLDLDDLAAVVDPHRRPGGRADLPHPRRGPLQVVVELPAGRERRAVVDEVDEPVPVVEVGQEGEAAGRVPQRDQVLEVRDLHGGVLEQHPAVPAEPLLALDEPGAHPRVGRDRRVVLEQGDGDAEVRRPEPDPHHVEYLRGGVGVRVRGGVIAEARPRGAVRTGQRGDVTQVSPIGSTGRHGARTSARGCRMPRPRVIRSDERASPATRGVSAPAGGVPGRATARNGGATRDDHVPRGADDGSPVPVAHERSPLDRSASPRPGTDAVALRTRTGRRRDLWPGGTAPGRAPPSCAGRPVAARPAAAPAAAGPGRGGRRGGRGRRGPAHRGPAGTDRGAALRAAGAGGRGAHRAVGQRRAPAAPDRRDPLHQHDLGVDLRGRAAAAAGARDGRRRRHLPAPLPTGGPPERHAAAPPGLQRGHGAARRARRRGAARAGRRPGRGTGDPAERGAGAGRAGRLHDGEHAPGRVGAAADRTGLAVPGDPAGRRHRPGAGDAVDRRAGRGRARQHLPLVRVARGAAAARRRADHPGAPAGGAGRHRCQDRAAQPGGVALAQPADAGARHAYRPGRRGADPRPRPLQGGQRPARPPGGRRRAPGRRRRPHRRGPRPGPGRPVRRRGVRGRARRDARRRHPGRPCPRGRRADPAGRARAAGRHRDRRAGHRAVGVGRGRDDARPRHGPRRPAGRRGRRALRGQARGPRPGRGPAPRTTGRRRGRDAAVRAELRHLRRRVTAPAAPAPGPSTGAASRRPRGRAGRRCRSARSPHRGQQQVAQLLEPRAARQLVAEHAGHRRADRRTEPLLLGTQRLGDLGVGPGGGPQLHRRPEVRLGEALPQQLDDPVGAFEPADRVGFEHPSHALLGVGDAFDREVLRRRDQQPVPAGEVVQQPAARDAGGRLDESQTPADHLLHDLGGAAVDPGDARVGVGLRDRVLVHVAVPAVQLQAAVDDPALQLGAPVLRLRRVDRRQLAGVERAHAVVDVVLRDVDLGVHLGEDELGVLERADRRAERLALLDVGQRLVQRRAGRRDTRDRDRQALLGQLLDQLDEALPLLGPEQVRHRDLDVGEGQLRGVLGVLAELVQVAAALEALHPALEHEQAHALVLLRRVGLHRGDDQVGVDPVGDEGLRAVDDVVVAVADRRRRHRRQVRADARLGHGDGEDRLAADDARQPALPLLVGTVGEQVGQHDVVVQGQAEAGPCGADTQQLLADDGVEPEVLDPAAAELLGRVDAQEAVRTGGGEQLPRDGAVTFPLRLVRDDLLLDEGAERLPEVLVVGLVERALHGAASPRVVVTSAAASGWRRRDGSSRRSAWGSRRCVRRACRTRSAGPAATDPDAEVGQVAGDRQGHADDAALGRRVRGLPDLALERRDRGGVDDDAAVAVDRLGLRDPLRGEADHVERADQVDVDDLGEVGQRERAVLADGLDAVADAGAVHRDADRTELFGGVEGGGHLLLVRDVGRGEADVLAQLVGDGLTGRGRQVDDDDLAAGLDELLGGGQAQAGRAAEELEDGGVGLAAALAHGLQAVADAVVAHVVHERGHDPGAGAAERVAERDRAAVRVEPGGDVAVVVGDVGQPGQRHRGEGLVDLERADLVQRQAGALQRLLRRRDRRGQHDHRVGAGEHRGVHPRDRGQPSSRAFSEALERAAAADTLVGGDAGDRGDLAVEAAVVLRGGSALVRLQGELVETLSREAPLLGDHLGADALVRRDAVALGEVVAQRVLLLARGAHRDPGHRLDATGDGDVVLPGDQAGRGEVHGLLARPALAVHAHAGHRLREPGGQGGVAGDVEGLLAALGHAAPDDVLDLRRVDAGPLDQAAQHMGRQVGGVDAGEAALALADRAAYSLDDDCVSHGVRSFATVDGARDGAVGSSRRRRWPTPGRPSHPRRRRWPRWPRWRRRLGGVGGVGGVAPEDPLLRRDERRYGDLPGDVGRGAHHVQDRVDADHDRDPGRDHRGRHPDRGEGQGQHGEPAGRPGGGQRPEHRDGDDHQVLPRRQLHAGEVRDEDRGERRVDGGAAVHLRGRAQRHREARVVALDAEVDRGLPGHRQGGAGRAGDEGELQHRPGGAEEAARPDPGHDLQQQRVDPEQDDRAAEVDGDDQPGERGDDAAAVGRERVADQAEHADRGEHDDPADDRQDDLERRAGERDERLGLLPQRVGGGADEQRGDDDLQHVVVGERGERVVRHQVRQQRLPRSRGPRAHGLDVGRVGGDRDALTGPPDQPDRDADQHRDQRGPGEPGDGAPAEPGRGAAAAEVTQADDADDDREEHQRHDRELQQPGEQPADGVQRGRETRGPGDPGGEPEQGAEHEPGEGEEGEHAGPAPGAGRTDDEGHGFPQEVRHTPVPRTGGATHPSAVIFPPDGGTQRDPHLRPGPSPHRWGGRVRGRLGPVPARGREVDPPGLGQQVHRQPGHQQQHDRVAEEQAGPADLGEQRLQVGRGPAEQRDRDRVRHPEPGGAHPGREHLGVEGGPDGAARPDQRERDGHRDEQRRPVVDHRIEREQRQDEHRAGHEQGAAAAEPVRGRAPQRQQHHEHRQRTGAGPQRRRRIHPARGDGVGRGRDRPDVVDDGQAAGQEHHPGQRLRAGQYLAPQRRAAGRRGAGLLLPCVGVGLTHPQPHDQRVQPEQPTQDERHPPAVGGHLLAGEHARQDGSEHRPDQDARGAGEVDEARPQPAPCGRGHLGEVGLCGGQLAPVGEALRQPGQDQHDRCGDADDGVGRDEPDHQAAHRGGRHAQRHRQLPAAAIGDPAEQEAAERAGDEPDGEHREGLEQGGAGVVAREELRGEERRERRVDVPVEPLHGVAGADPEDRATPLGALGHAATPAAGARRVVASAAYSAVASARTPSSKRASGEWFIGAVPGSAPGGQAPIPRNAPGTAASTREKSSEPLTGFGASRNRSSPSSSAHTPAANPASSASLTVRGYSSVQTTSARTPCAAATPSQTSRTSTGSVAAWASEKLRTVASKRAVSGMTLRRVPAATTPTVSTTGSNMSKRRVTIVCRAVIISAAAAIGSRAVCGLEPWPPAPCTTTSSACEADRNTPGRVVTSPAGIRLANTCRP
ncbi:hypothetical protein L7F22_009759 [Adiantum nelumboides]|nr:hypothetical protein [Adiantum nelumboides]